MLLLFHPEILHHRPSHYLGRCFCLSLSNIHGTQRSNCKCSTKPIGHQSGPMLMTSFSLRVPITESHDAYFCSARPGRNDADLTTQTPYAAPDVCQHISYLFRLRISSTGVTRERIMKPLRHKPNRLQGNLS